MRPVEPVAERLQLLDGLFFRQLGGDELAPEVFGAGKYQEPPRFLRRTDGVDGEVPRRASLPVRHDDRSVDLDPLVQSERHQTSPFASLSATSTTIAPLTLR